MSRWFMAAAAVVLATAAVGYAADRSPWVAPFTSNWAGADNLGRSLPTPAETGPPKPGRYVGLFYWQWHGAMPPQGEYDMTRFLQSHPRFEDFNGIPGIGEPRQTFYWGRPVFDYYRSDDPWAIRKQISLIADMGVDFLFMDYTNNAVYDRELTTYLKVSDELKASGLRVPRLTFFMNRQPEPKVESMYLNWYKPGRHADDWFIWDGKPLMMSPMPTDASKLKHPELLKEIQNYFTWRPTWALEKADQNPRLWRFIGMPSDKPAVDATGKVEQIVVCKSMGGPIGNAMDVGGVSGQSGLHHELSEYNDEWMLPDAAQGKFFQAEWDRAEKLTPPIVLLTGWNEWTASVWSRPGVVMLGRKTTGRQGHIVDEFNQQFDRDIEPMRGGYGDDYYWQAVENIRRYKGLPPAEAVSAEKTIDVAGAASQWDGVTPVYRDTVGDVADRRWPGSPAGTFWTNLTARNDLATMQVARDKSNVVFRATVHGKLSPATDPNWMVLWIDSDGNRKTGWNGYDLRVHLESGQAIVERADRTDFNWRVITAGGASTTADAVTFSVPRDRIGDGPLHLQFKWTDNLPEQPAAADFYTDGDAAPDGRFNYHFDEPSP